jgi:hypothetical protein
MPKGSEHGRNLMPEDKEPQINNCDPPKAIKEGKITEGKVLENL